MAQWRKYIQEIHALLEDLSVTDKSGEEIGVLDAFSYLAEVTVRTRENGNRVYLIGNGASASMASHIAADLGKNGALRTEVFTDLSLITAVSNDISYEEVFAESLRRKMDEADMVVAISSSGRSPNVIKAAEEARSLGGFVITLTAMAPDNQLRGLGDLNFYIPAWTYGLAETCHAAILHFWVDMITT